MLKNMQSLNKVTGISPPLKMHQEFDLYEIRDACTIHDCSRYTYFLIYRSGWVWFVKTTKAVCVGKNVYKVLYMSSEKVTCIHPPESEVVERNGVVTITIHKNETECVVSMDIF